MGLNGRRFLAGIAGITLSLRLFAGLASAQEVVEQPSPQSVREAAKGTLGSPYIPVDSWIYGAALRLNNLGYLSTLYVGMRPYTRVSLMHAMKLSEDAIHQDDILYGNDDEAVELYARLKRELAPEFAGTEGKEIISESQYARAREIAGPPINDSFHVGQTFVDDYGRPFQEGFNSIAGSSGYATYGRFNLYVRGEYQHAPAAIGYSAAVAAQLEANDGLPPGPHFDIPQGHILEANQVRMLEDSVSAHLFGHQFSFGRSDAWLGPSQSAAMVWSNNAEPIYNFRIDRIEPMYIPFLSRLTGPFRYEFFVGSLKGHDYPNSPWIHLEKVSFKPLADLEFGFTRSIIWGGKGHEPITVGTFLNGFFSPAGVDAAIKFSRNDPGARFTSFDANYRMPWKRHLFTVYTDSFVHDAVFPVSNFAASAWRPGVLLNRLPLLPRVDLRVEGAYTDVSDPRSLNGNLIFYEVVQRQGYTNRSFLLGDWIGREDKGGDATLTWHYKPDQKVEFEYRRVKAAKDFIPSGTTQQDFTLTGVLRPIRDLEVRGGVQPEFWRAPLLRQGLQRSVSLTLMLIYYPPFGSGL